MASQGNDGRWWESLVLPVLEAESGVYRASLLYSRLADELAGTHRGATTFSILLLEGRSTFGWRLKAASVRAVAGLLFSTSRQEDVPARLGPRTFALLLPGLGEATATRIARALELDLRLTSIGTGDHWNVSCLSYPAQKEGLERLAAAAHAPHISGGHHSRRPAA